MVLFHFLIAFFHTIGEESFLPQGSGDGQTHDTWHWTHVTDSSLLVSYTHRRRTLKAVKGNTEVVFGNRENTQGLLEAGFRASRRLDDTLVGSCGKKCLACLNNSVVCWGTETCYSRTSRNGVQSPFKRAVWLQDLFCGSSVEVTCSQAIMAFPVVLHVKAAHDTEP